MEGGMKTWKKLLGVGAMSAALLSLGATMASAEYKAEHRGGTMRIVARSAAGTLDPMINYTLQYWQIYQSVYDGLVNFKKAPGEEGFTVVPDIAEAIPAPQNDGKTYVFKIRKGIKFSDGREVGVKDIVASFQRIFKVSSPTAGSFYAGIVGADKCLADAKTCTLEGGVVGDEAAGTVALNLGEGGTGAMYKLAVPAASVLSARGPAPRAGAGAILWS